MKVSFRIGGRPSAELASKTPDPDLIDCYIVQLNAARKRYRYLLNQWNGLDKVSAGDV